MDVAPVEIAAPADALLVPAGSRRDVAVAAVRRYRPTVTAGAVLLPAALPVTYAGAVLAVYGDGTLLSSGPPERPALLGVGAVTMVAGLGMAESSPLIVSVGALQARRAAGRYGLHVSPVAGDVALGLWGAHVALASYGFADSQAHPERDHAVVGWTAVGLLPAAYAAGLVQWEIDLAAVGRHRSK